MNQQPNPKRTNDKRKKSTASVADDPVHLVPPCAADLHPTSVDGYDHDNLKRPSKRVCNPQQWKRWTQKQHMKEFQPCSCRSQCPESVGLISIQAHREAYTKLRTFQLQKLFLRTMIRLEIKTTDKPKWQFCLPTTTSPRPIKVCRQMFLGVFSKANNTLISLCKTILTGSPDYPVDGN